MDVLDKHQEYLNSPEFQKKEAVENAEPMSAEELGFNPIAEPVKREPVFIPSTRKKAPIQDDDSHLFESDMTSEALLKEEEEGPFRKKTTKKTFEES